MSANAKSSGNGRIAATTLLISSFILLAVVLLIANYWRPVFIGGQLKGEHIPFNRPNAVIEDSVLSLIGLSTALGAIILLRRQSKLLSANQELNEELQLRIQESSASREDLDRYFTLSIDMLCILGFDGYFKRLNPAWEKTLGYSTEELLKIPRIDLVHPDDRAATINEIRLLTAGRNSVAFENRYRRKDGSYVWLSWSGTALPEQKLMYAVARDISTLKTSETALRVAKEEAERSSKFKDQFLSTMSHELRTPLNAVVGFSELLLDGQPGPVNDRQRRYIKHIHTGGHHLLRLINDILDLSKIEAGRLQLSTLTVDVAQCFREVVETLCPLAEKKGLAIRQCETDLTVAADETRFKQVLMNLLGNAIKFTPERGFIQLDAHAIDGFVRIDVRDSGPGIPPGEEARIFEAFYRSSQHGNQVEGSGLGLAITRRLVELQGGEISVESRPNSGCCFSFTLPKGLIDTQASQPLAAPPAFASHTYSKGDGYVLVVEDDGATREFLREMLSKRGLNAKSASNVPEARHQLSVSSPDLIILDLILPGESGVHMLAELRNDRRYRDVPVFILTSKDLTTAEQAYLRQHANSVVRKEGSWHEALLDQIRRLPQNRLAMTES